MIVGSGEFQYRVNADWAKLSDNWSFREVGEVGPAAVSRDIPQLGPRVSIVDHTGKLIGRFGETPAGTELGKFLTPHGLAVNSRGDVHVREVSWTARPKIDPDTPQPAHIRSLQKFERVE
jgi:hypothetical protein